VKTIRSETFSTHGLGVEASGNGITTSISTIVNFKRFRSRHVHILEIGIYSGGSLEMWHDYFGPRSHVYGVDLQEECRRYETDSTRIFIGDQADRDFWRRFRAEVPTLDIVVDEGGHQPHPQAVSLEELLPYLQPHGVYLIEDLHGRITVSPLT
jgi:hypothetical protein